MSREARIALPVWSFKRSLSLPRHRRRSAHEGGKSPLSPSRALFNDGRPYRCIIVNESASSSWDSVLNTTGLGTLQEGLWTLSSGRMMMRGNPEFVGAPSWTSCSGCGA